MKKLELNLMNEFTYISSLKSNPSHTKLAYILHKPDIKTNTYVNDLYLFVKNNQSFPLTNHHKLNSFLWLDDNNIIYSKIHDAEEERLSKLQYTFIYKLSLNGGESQLFAQLPLAAEILAVLPDDKYLLQANVSLETLDLHKQSEEDRQKTYDAEQTEDYYRVIDEIPFYINGQSFISHSRSRLYIYDRKQDKCHCISQNYNVILHALNKERNRIVFSGVDINSKKPILTEALLEYDLNKEDFTVEIPDTGLSIAHVDYIGKKICLFASDMQKSGLNQDSDFYVYRENQIQKVLHIDMSIGNSIVTDIFYGSNKQFLIIKDQLYFIATKNASAGIYKIYSKDKNWYCESVVDEALRKLSLQVLGFCYADRHIYINAIGAKNLSEIYEVRNEALSSEDSETGLRLHTDYSAVLNPYYIAQSRAMNVESNGALLDAWVLLPENFDVNQTYPAIFDIHGGPKTAYSDVYCHEMQVWVNMGYVVFYCNPHGSSSYGDDFSDIRGQYGSIDFEDLLKVKQEVLKLYPNIDPQRVAITGGSYGGFMTNWMISHNDEFVCAATQRSISNWLSMYGVADIGTYFVEDQLSLDTTKEEGFIKAWDYSPLKYVNKVKTPCLILHSDQDYRCTLEQAYQWFTALKMRNIDTKLIIFNGENHNLSRSGKPKARIKRLEELSLWFEKYCK